MVQADKEQVKEHPAGFVSFEHRIVPEDLPAVVFLAGPELPAVGAAARKVIGKPRTPDRHQHGHQHQTVAKARRIGHIPGVADGQDAPELIHLAVVMREVPHGKAEQGHSQRRPKQMCKNFFLLKRERLIHINGYNGNDNDGKEQNNNGFDHRAGFWSGW